MTVQSSWCLGFPQDFPVQTNQISALTTRNWDQLEFYLICMWDVCRTLLMSTLNRLVNAYWTTWQVPAVRVIESGGTHLAERSGTILSALKKKNQYKTFTPSCQAYVLCYSWCHFHFAIEIGEYLGSVHSSSILSHCDFYKLVETPKMSYVPVLNSRALILWHSVTFCDILCPLLCRRI